MKNFFLSILGLLTFGASWASLPGEGYYRVNNYKSERYVFVYDNKGSLDIGAMKADMGAIQLWKPFERTISDPASVIYLQAKSDGKFDFLSQGTGVHDIINMYVKLWEVPAGSGLYLIGATYQNITKYLCDSQIDLSLDRGMLNDNGSGDWRKWQFTPIDASTDNYFGVAPEINLGNDYYTTLYASFPFSFHSSGMKAYIVDRIENGMAIMKEISGTVASKTPVIIKCSSSEATNNRLNIGGSATAPSTNLLGGVFFNNSSNAHNNQTAFDSNTMRVLGLTSDGKLGFVTSGEQYLAANRAYLKVPSGTPSELKLVTEEEYAQMYVTISVTTPSADQGTVYIDNEGTTTVETQIGSKHNLVAKAKAPYKFKNWTLNGSQVSTSATYEVTVNESAEYQANFVLTQYKVNLTSTNGTLSVTANGDPLVSGQNYDHGTEVKIVSATANDNHILSSITVNGNDVTDSFTSNGSHTFTLTEASNIVGTFVIVRPKLHLSQEGEGMVKVSSQNSNPASLSILFNDGDEIDVDEGSRLYFYLIPDDGKMVSAFNVNGHSLDDLTASGNVSGISGVTNGKKIFYVMTTDDVTASATFTDDAAIEVVGADAIRGDAEYFNLQGVKVNPDDLVPGLYLRRVGNHVEKVIVK